MRMILGALHCLIGALHMWRTYYILSAPAAHGGTDKLVAAQSIESNHHRINFPFVMHATITPLFSSQMGVNGSTDLGPVLGHPG